MTFDMGKYSGKFLKKHGIKISIISDIQTFAPEVTIENLNCKLQYKTTMIEITDTNFFDNAIDRFLIKENKNLTRRLCTFLRKMIINK
jgi:hypothetical protein